MTRCPPLLCLGGLALLAGCLPPPPPVTAPTPQPAAPPVTIPGVVRLLPDWERRLVLVQEDSVLVTAGSGERQLERRGHRAVIRVSLSRGATLRIVLDSLTLAPASTPLPEGLVGTVWTARIDSQGEATDLTPNRRTAMTDDFSGVFRLLLPPIPARGISTGMRWSAPLARRANVHVFGVTESGLSTWEVGATTRDGTVQILPMTLRESYEQIGTGTQAGRSMTMTAQGVRRVDWQLRLDGLVDRAEIRDSSANLVTIQGTRQAVPAMEIRRTRVTEQPTQP